MKELFFQVTSTVTIPTPEQPMQEEAGDTPSVWEGTVIMPDVTKFKVRSYQVDSILINFATFQYSGVGHL